MADNQRDHKEEHELFKSSAEDILYLLHHAVLVLDYLYDSKQPRELDELLHSPELGDPDHVVDIARATLPLKKFKLIEGYNGEDIKEKPSNNVEACDVFHIIYDVEVFVIECREEYN